MSLGLIVNVLFVLAALYFFQRSLRMLYALVRPEAPRKSWRDRLRAVADASRVMMWFSLGTVVMIAGLTGLLSRMLLWVL